MGVAFPGELFEIGSCRATGTANPFILREIKMKSTETETQQEIDEFVEKLGPLELDLEAVRRVKEAEKAARNQRKGERAQRTR